MPTVIEVRDVEQLYHEGTRNVVHALRGASLNVAEGELVAVMGPSGSGKTTLLNVIGCLARPTAGHIELGGRDVTRLRDRELDDIRARKVGFVFQSYSLIPTMSALENVALAAHYAGTPRAERKALAAEALAAVDLEDQAHQLAAELSGGERQRVTIARALVKSPSILLADEPTGNLDSVSADEIMSMIRGLRSGTQTTLLVTHDPRMAGYADRVVFLKDGRVVDEEELR
jgi:putative ABC transport system ATP-binding protein